MNNGHLLLLSTKKWLYLLCSKPWTLNKQSTTTFVAAKGFLGAHRLREDNSMRAIVLTVKCSSAWRADPLLPLCLYSNRQHLHLRAQTFCDVNVRIDRGVSLVQINQSPRLLQRRARQQEGDEGQAYRQASWRERKKWLKCFSKS